MLSPDTGSHTPVWHADSPPAADSRPRTRQERVLDLIPPGAVTQHVPAEASAVAPLPVAEEAPQPNMDRVWNHLELIFVLLLSICLASLLGG